MCSNFGVNFPVSTFCILHKVTCVYQYVCIDKIKMVLVKLRDPWLVLGTVVPNYVIFYSFCYSGILFSLFSLFLSFALFNFALLDSPILRDTQ